jgi:glycerate-2-kinase
MQTGERLRSFVPFIQRAAEVGPAVTRALESPEISQLLRGRIRILAFGKASVEMTAAAAAYFDTSSNIVRSTNVDAMVIGVPERIALAQTPGATRKMPEGWRAYPADHPLAAERNIVAAKAALEFVETNRDDDLLLVLISGGGSAHLCWPDGELTLDDLREVTRDLQRSGATIDELNTVRKHCERLKGGRLSAALKRGQALALVVSDVIGDRLDVIASGPFVPDPTTFDDALDVLDRRGVATKAVRQHLEHGKAGSIQDTPKPSNPNLARIDHHVVLSNASIVRDVVSHIERTGAAADMEIEKSGEAADIGRDLAAWIRSSPKGRFKVVGGEWTVSVGNAPGRGGPSLELALAAALEIKGREEVALLAYSTDGIDGPTDAAGALVDGQTFARAKAAGVDPLDALLRHDSLIALDAAEAVLRTGPSGTNVNHIVIALA